MNAFWLIFVVLHLILSLQTLHLGALWYVSLSVIKNKTQMFVFCINISSNGIHERKQHSGLSTLNTLPCNAMRFRELQKLGLKVL